MATIQSIGTMQVAVRAAGRRAGGGVRRHGAVDRGLRFRWTATETRIFIKPEVTPERREFYDRIGTKGAAPLWEVLTTIIPAKPSPGTVPVLWRYDDMRPLLMEAGRLLTPKEAERRVLMLENPGARGSRGPPAASMPACS